MTESIRRQWPAWTVLAFLALLPARRLSEIPMVVLAISTAFLWRSEAYGERTRYLFRMLLPLFACFWVPMLFSAFDSLDPVKSWSQTLVNLRFLFAAVAVGVLLHDPTLRRRVLQGASYLLLFWVLDGLIQLGFGVDLFGIELRKDRLSALFGDRSQFYGPILAMLSPLLLEYARRYWPNWAWVVALMAIITAVMISGMRAAWVVMALIFLVYAVGLLRPDRREMRKSLPLLIPLFIIVLTVSFAISPVFQARVHDTLALKGGSQAALNEASSLRLPIFRNSWAMAKDYPFNGVGIGAFPIGYQLYADTDDPHYSLDPSESRASHSHNVILELLSEMGSAGLLGMIMGAWFAWRLWQKLGPWGRRQVFPFAFAIGLILFPANTHFAIYGTFLSSLLWILAGCFASALPCRGEASCGICRGEMTPESGQP